MSIKRYREIREQIDGEDLFLIAEIAHRGHNLAQQRRWVYEFYAIKEDLIVVHGTVGLDLKKMRTSLPLELAHDIFGIRNHLNLETLELENGFVPKFAKPPSPEEQATCCSAFTPYTEGGSEHDPNNCSHSLDGSCQCQKR